MTTIIPPSVPGLPTVEALLAEQIVKPAHVDDSQGSLRAVSLMGRKALANPIDGFRLDIPMASTTAIAGPITARTQRHEDDKAWLITTHSIDDLCIVISGGTNHDQKATAITAIFPADALESATRTGSGGAVVDVTSIEERLEFTHVFDVSALGVATVESAKVTHKPEHDRGELAPKIRHLNTFSDALAHFYGQAIVQSTDDAPGAEADITTVEKVVVGVGCGVAITVTVVLAVFDSPLVQLPLEIFGASLGTFAFIRQQPAAADPESVSEYSSESYGSP